MIGAKRVLLCLVFLAAVVVVVSCQSKVSSPVSTAPPPSPVKQERNETEKAVAKIQEGIQSGSFGQIRKAMRERIKKDPKDKSALLQLGFFAFCVDKDTTSKEALAESSKALEALSELGPRDEFSKRLLAMNTLCSDRSLPVYEQSDGSKKLWTGEALVPIEELPAIRKSVLEGNTNVTGFTILN